MPNSMWDGTPVPATGFCGWPYATACGMIEVVYEDGKYADADEDAAAATACGETGERGGENRWTGRDVVLRLTVGL